MQGGLLTVALMVCAASVMAQQQRSPASAAPIPAGLPEWAYEAPVQGEPTAPSILPTDDNALVRIPGSEKELTRGQLRGVPEIADWHPEDHRGAVPVIVKIGRIQGGVRACGFCHLADGSGRPENAPVSGLPAAYVIQQMEDFKNGLRDSADPRKTNTDNMIGFAKNATAEEVRAAAEYFAAQPYPKRFTVLESHTAPKLILQDGMHVPIVGEGAGMEPLGNEIVEVPDNNLRSAARDTRLSWTSYVPVGSISKGKALVAQYRCTTCHGANLEGLGPVPPVAGRSASYTVRQMSDIKTGTRHGLWSELMKPVVEKMTPQDMLNVAAYTVSLAPPPGARAGTR
jgi:cytochrome c553